MKLERLAPMLRTWDLGETIAFYRDRLGFRCAKFDAEAGWATLERDGIRLMLSAPNEHEGDERPRFTGSLYFETDDVDALWESLRDRARVSYAIETFDYGMREFAVYDSNGYLLQFGQEVAARAPDADDDEEETRP